MKTATRTRRLTKLWSWKSPARRRDETSGLMQAPVSFFFFHWLLVRHFPNEIFEHSRALETLFLSHRSRTLDFSRQVFCSKVISDLIVFLLLFCWFWGSINCAQVENRFDLNKSEISPFTDSFIYFVHVKRLDGAGMNQGSLSSCTAAALPNVHWRCWFKTRSSSCMRPTGVKSKCWIENGARPKRSMATHLSAVFGFFLLRKVSPWIFGLWVPREWSWIVLWLRKGNTVAFINVDPKHRTQCFFWGCFFSNMGQNCCHNLTKPIFPVDFLGFFSSSETSDT